MPVRSSPALGERESCWIGRGVRQLLCVWPVTGRVRRVTPANGWRTTAQSGGARTTAVLVPAGNYLYSVLGWRLASRWSGCSDARGTTAFPCPTCGMLLDSIAQRRGPCPRCRAKVPLTGRHSGLLFLRPVSPLPESDRWLTARRLLDPGARDSHPMVGEDSSDCRYDTGGLVRTARPADPAATGV